MPSLTQEQRDAVHAADDAKDAKVRAAKIDRDFAIMKANEAVAEAQERYEAAVQEAEDEWSKEFDSIVWGLRKPGRFG